jgi:predicted enzyme related to lactoylglutathione lyase
MSADPGEAEGADGGPREGGISAQENPVMSARHALTILAVEDLQCAVAFYTSAFGWPQIVDAPVYAEFELPGVMRLGLYQREGYGRNTGQVPARLPAGEITGTELYLYPDDLAEAVQRLEAAGARKLSDLVARDWGDEAAYFADPEGNVLVVARPTSPSVAKLRQTE